MQLIIIIAIVFSLVDEIANVKTYKEVYISKTTEKSWKIAANRCIESGMNLLILKTVTEKSKLLSIHDSYKHGSEWTAFTDMERNCPPTNYNNEKSPFFDCHFFGFCYPYSFNSKSNIYCRTGKKYLCEKIVNTKKLKNVKVTTLESTTQTINCKKIIQNDGTYDIFCDQDDGKVNIEIHDQMKVNDGNVTSIEKDINHIFSSTTFDEKYIILIILCFIAILIIIICCRKKCFKFYNNIETTIILTNSLESL